MPDLKKLITLEALQAALPSWLKSSSKPSYTADEINDSSTANKFVTSTEKNTWNAKGTYSKPSGGIPKTDLSQFVQNSLDLADSALQSESDPTVPSWAKQTDKPSYTQDEVTDGTTYKRVTQTEKNAWSGKQNALTTTQMSAVNSGINSTKVGQISTNQTNILSVEDMVCATEFSSSTAYAVGDMVTYEHKLYKFINAHQGAWSASDVQNYDLTRLEAEDRASLAEVVDSGAKNLVDWRNTTSVSTEITISDGTYTSNHSDTRTTLRFQVSALNSNGTIISTFNGDGTIPTGNGVLNVPFILPSGTAKIRAGHNGSQRNTRFDIPISGTTLEVGKSYVLQVNVTQYTDPSGIFKWKDLMICTKAAFGVSQKFVPYLKSNVLKEYSLNLHNQTYVKSAEGLYYMSQGIDLSSTFSEIYAVTIKTFNAVKNVALLPAFDGTTLKLCISDPTAPTTLTFSPTNALVKFNVYGKEA